ncbi:MAG: hemerythrin domain-containing protein [Thermoprotei archaeon]
MSVRALLLEDHARTESTLEELISRFGGDARRAFDEFSRTLLSHIYFEEEALFPELLSRHAGLSGVVRGLEFEHGAVCKLLAKAGAALEAGDLASATGALEGVLRILKGNGIQEGHHQREDETVYVLVEKLDADAVSRIRRKLKGLAVPEGWVCRSLRGA